MRNRLRSVLAIMAICAGCGILFLEAVLLVSGVWRARFAALGEPVDLFSGVCDVSQLEEMEVVSGTVCELSGRYDYTYDSYISDIAYYYVMPVAVDGRTYYIGIRETKGRKDLFRNLSAVTEFDVKERGVNVRPFQKDADAEEKPVFVEGFLFRMNGQQYGRLQTWLEKAGADGQALPYYIEERNITKYGRECISGLVWTVVSVVMVAAGAAQLIHWRRRRRSQTHITIGNVVYEKGQLDTVNQLIEHIEMMQAIQELSRITGLEMLQAEKVVRHWYDYWY